jgi:hypothetical protein
MGGAISPAHYIPKNEVMQNELTAQVEEKGFKVPAGATTEKDIKECLELIELGSNQEELDKKFPAPRSNKKEAPQAKMVSADDAQRMADDAARKAVEAMKENMQANPITVKMDDPTKDTRPDMYDNSNIPSDKYVKDTLRVYHRGNDFLMTDFQIGGQYVRVPCAKRLNFRNDNGRGTRRFGDAVNTAYRCYFDTNHKDLQELFMKDDRMGGEFWLSNKDRDMDRDTFFASLVTKYNGSYAGYGESQVNELLTLRGLPMGGSLSQKRNALAVWDAKNEMKESQGKGLWKDAESERASLLQ